MHQTKSLPALIVIGVALLLPAAAPAQAPTAEDLQRCSEIDDNEARLRCFDGLTDAPEPIVAPAPEAVRPGAATAQPVQSAAPPARTVEPMLEAAPAPPARTLEPMPEAAPAPAPAAEETADQRFGSEQVTRDEEPERLIARVVGDFEGWSGDTLFELDNGQVWRQAEFGRLNYRGPANPEVTIKKGFFGTYRLTVEGTNRWIRVKRVK